MQSRPPQNLLYVLPQTSFICCSRLTVVWGNVSFPQVSLLQKKDWPQQAELETTPDAVGPECFMGYYDTSGPDCGDDNVSSAPTCTCSKLWNSSIDESFTWDGSDYRVMHFGSAEWLQPPTRTFLLLLKVSFSCKYPEKCAFQY
jgi:hypothetical protein